MNPDGFLVRHDSALIVEYTEDRLVITTHVLAQLVCGGSSLFIVLAAALQRFFACLTGPAAAPAPQPSKQRQQEQRRVQAALDSAGFKTVGLDDTWHTTGVMT
jgi:hypothetical protein